MGRQWDGVCFFWKQQFLFLLSQPLLGMSFHILVPFTSPQSSVQYKQAKSRLTWSLSNRSHPFLACPAAHSPCWQCIMLMIISERASCSIQGACLALVHVISGCYRMATGRRFISKGLGFGRSGTNFPHPQPIHGTVPSPMLLGVSCTSRKCSARGVCSADSIMLTLISL